MAISYYRILDIEKIWCVKNCTFLANPETDTVYQEWLNTQIGTTIIGNELVEVFNRPIILNEEKCLYSTLKNYSLPYPKTQEELLSDLRVKRNQLLTESDFMMMPDYALDSATQREIAIYRAKLKDITRIEGCPWDGGNELTPWPDKPQSLLSRLH